MTTVRRLRVVLKIRRQSTASVLGRARAIAQGMAADTTRFAAPTPPLATLQSQIEAVEAAEHKAQTRTKGTVAERNFQRDALVGMLETERAYVQVLCDASPEQAEVIIKAAGMEVARPPSHADPLLKVVSGASSGAVTLDAHAARLTGRTGKRAFFNWQWTADGGQTFHDAPPTARGKTTIANLPLLSMVGFRVSVTDTRGPGAWSEVVSVVVH
jgi:hypothetical protein